jgi:hypothetical protein
VIPSFPRMCVQFAEGGLGPSLQYRGHITEHSIATVEKCNVMRKVIDIYGRRRLSIYGIKRCYAIRNKMKLSHAFKPCDLTNSSMHLEPRWFDVYASGIVPPGIMH